MPTKKKKLAKRKKTPLSYILRLSGVFVAIIVILAIILLTQIQFAPDRFTTSANDTDNDGFSDTIELKIGTSPQSACPLSSSDNAWPPDVNNDGRVDIKDFSVMRSRMWSNKGDYRYKARLDLNSDNKINNADVDIYKRYFGKTCPIVSPSLIINNANGTITPSSFVPDVDSFTKEFYDVDIFGSVKTIINSNPGPLYSALTTFTISGPRIESLSELTGFFKRPNNTSQVNSLTFTRNSTQYPRFTSQPVRLDDNDCIDLYSSPTKDSDKYALTFCYRVTFITNSTQPIYSYSANPYLKLTYTGKQPVAMLFLTTGFDKNNLPGVGTRVNFFTYDLSAASITNFKDIVYTIQPLTDGNNPSDQDNWCQLNLSKKYLGQSFSPKPEGGNLYPITQQVSSCIYEFKTNSLLTGYLRLGRYTN